MIQTKNEWIKQIQVLIKHIKIGLPVLFLLVSSYCYLPILNQLNNNFPKNGYLICKVKDDYNTWYTRKNLLDPGTSYLSS
jgi:hypothetical protein